MSTAEPFVAVHVDAVPPGPDRGSGIAELKPVRRHLGIEAFGANARVARAAGEVLVMPHDERAGGPFGTDGHEELYVVLRGRATFTVDGRDVDAPAGTLVFVRDPALERSSARRSRRRRTPPCSRSAVRRASRTASRRGSSATSMRNGRSRRRL